MQTLSNVNIRDIRVGDRVRSMNTGKEAFISNKIIATNEDGKEDFALIVRWEPDNVIQYTNYLPNHLLLI